MLTILKYTFIIAKSIIQIIIMSTVVTLAILNNHYNKQSNTQDDSIPKYKYYIKTEQTNYIPMYNFNYKIPFNSKHKENYENENERDINMLHKLNIYDKKTFNKWCACGGHPDKGGDTELFIKIKKLFELHLQK
jgi:hypothetical protein